MKSKVETASLSLVVAMALVCTTSFAADPLRVDYLQDKDPPLKPALPPLASREVWKTLWVKALNRPEVDTQRRAAAAITLAHSQGMPGLKETVPDLVKQFDAPDAHPAVRYACAKALVALDARQHAPQLRKVLNDGDEDLCEVVEPALARWNDLPSQDVWIARLKESDLPRRKRIRTLRALGEVRNPKAAETLQTIVVNHKEPADVRLEAAAALARIRPTGLEPIAGPLLAETSPRRLVDRLAGIRLLGEHQSPRAIELLQSVARDDEPAVASAALKRLLALSPDHLLPHAEWGVSHPDASVRWSIAAALSERPTPEHIRLLSLLLDDSDPDNRTAVREYLYRLSKDHKDDVILGCVTMLASHTRPRAEQPAAPRGDEPQGDGPRPPVDDNWRGLEQATLILGTLDHEPAAPRLLELMKHPRKEVFVTAAWALREMAIADTLPALLEMAKAETESRLKKVAQPLGQDDWLALQLELFAQMNYRPAEEVARKYLPKDFTMGPRSRCAAYRLIGLFHADENPEDLNKLFVERIQDIGGMPPEDDFVRYQAVIALGRMGSKGTIPQIRRFALSQSDLVSLGVAWTIEKLSGEKVALTPPVKRYLGPWFLDSVLSAEEEEPAQGKK